MKFLLFRCPIELINPGSTTYGYTPDSYPSLGLLYLGAKLEQAGHKVEIIDLCIENPSKEHLKKRLLASDAVGMEVYTDNLKFAADFSKSVKELTPDIPLIIGGPHCIFFQDRSLSDIPDADIAVISEGEETIVEIAGFLQGKKKLPDVHGIFYRDNNTIRKGKPIKFIKNLDTIPFPARHLVERYDYDKFPRGFLFKEKLTLMITSRGCPYHCRFCGRYGNTIKGYGFRRRSAENVVEEIQEIDNKYGSVMIVDDNFLADGKRANKIFDLLIEAGTDIELLIMGARVDSANKALYTKMKKANVKLIGFGIESGNQDVLDFYNKRITLKQIRDAVSLGREMGFQTVGTIIFGAPFETKKHFKETIKFSKSLPLDIAIFTVLKYCMGAPLWIEAVKENKISPDEFLVPAGSNRDLGNFTTEELYAYSRKAYRSFYFSTSYIFDQIHQSIVKKNFRFIKNSFEFLASFR